jgi:hypothetical protein
MVLDKICILSKFADDTKCGNTVNNTDEKEKLLSALDTLCDWSAKWQMQFNESKCKVLHLGRDNQRFTYEMNGTILETTDCEKDVGVNITCDLKPSIQCSRAAGKATTVLGMMARSFHYRDKGTWLKLYKMYVRPHLEYASPAWSPWLRKDVDVLEKVQERALKMCSGLRGRTYAERLAEVKLDSLEIRREKTDLTQVWKILHGQDNVREDLIFERLNVNAARVTRATSSIFNIKTPHCASDVRKNFFAVKIVEKWNNLPEEIKSATKICTFKSLLNDHYTP